MKILATMSLKAINRPNADHWNATLSCQKADENSTLSPAADCPNADRWNAARSRQLSHHDHTILLELELGSLVPWEYPYLHLRRPSIVQVMYDAAHFCD